MGTVFAAFLLSLLTLFTLTCGAEVTDKEEQVMIERIKDRCADFYHRRAEEERMDNERRAGVAAVKKLHLENQEKLEAAREKYVKERKNEIPNPKLEQEWNDQQKAWKEQNRVAGERWARKQDEVQAIQKRGCHVPENLEYDLDDE